TPNASPTFQAAGIVRSYIVTMCESHTVIYSWHHHVWRVLHWPILWSDTAPNKASRFPWAGLSRTRTRSKCSDTYLSSMSLSGRHSNVVCTHTRTQYSMGSCHSEHMYTHSRSIGYSHVVAAIVQSAEARLGSSVRVEIRTISPLC